MSFFSDLESAVASEAQKIWGQVEALAAELKPLAVASAQEVAQVALTTVLQQAPLVLSGAEKLSAGTANVINTLAAQGKTIAASAAEAAVQTSYNYLSTQLAAAKPAA